MLTKASASTGERSEADSNRGILTLQRLPVESIDLTIAFVIKRFTSQLKTFIK
jgi:hypothetical protein